MFAFFPSWWSLKVPPGRILLHAFIKQRKLKMFMKSWKEIPLAPFLPFHFASIQDLQEMFWTYEPLDWVISDIRGWAQLCTYKSLVSCANEVGGLGVGGVLLRYACEEALETTEIQAPHSLSYNGSFGARRTRKKWCMYWNLLPSQKCVE